MLTKKRRPFCLRDQYGDKRAYGVVYEQGNVQVLWRSDTGWGGEQYQTIANVMNIMDCIKSFHWEED